MAAAGRLGRGHPDPGLARARERLLPPGRRRCGPSPTGAGSAFRVEAPRAFASSADRLVVLARTGDDAEAIDLFLVDPDGGWGDPTPAVQHHVRHPVRGDVSDVRRMRRPHRPGGERDGPPGRSVLEPALVLLAAQAVGGARYALEITTQYAKDRQQFDKPLGAFQALAHYLADAVTNLDGAEQLVHEAAWAGATGRSLESLAPMAKLFACSTFRDITAMAQQIFGGIGFTLDFDIQLYFRRAKQQQLMWANDRTLEDAVAAPCSTELIRSSARASLGCCGHWCRGRNRRSTPSGKAQVKGYRRGGTSFRATGELPYPRLANRIGAEPSYEQRVEHSGRVAPADVAPWTSRDQAN